MQTRKTPAQPRAWRWAGSPRYSLAHHASFEMFPLSPCPGRDRGLCAHPTTLTWPDPGLGGGRMAQSGQGAGLLTPANADKHPLAQPVRGVREHDGRVQVAALAEHPEEVGHVEVVVGGCHQPAPALPPTPSEVMINRGGWGCEETAAHPGPGASSGQDGGIPGIHSGTMSSKAWFLSLLPQGHPTQTLPLTLGLPP